MESFNELCLKWWQGFYSSFQNSCTMTCISEQGALSMRHGEMSMLLGVGGSETSDLLVSCGIPDIDVIKFNQVLCQMETLCMPKIVLMYEQYKSSLHLEDKEGGLIVDAFQITDEGLCHSDPPKLDVSMKAEAGIEHLEIISAGDDFCLKSEVSEAPVSNDVTGKPSTTVVIPPPPTNNASCSHSGEPHMSSSTNGNREREMDESEQRSNTDETQSLDSTCDRGKNGLSEPSSEKETITAPPMALLEEEKDVMRVIPVQAKESQKVKEEVVENETNGGEFFNPVRRSSRQVKVSARFADDRDIIRRLIKPETCEVGESGAQEKFPIVCSTCQAVFTNPAALRTHWKSHRQNKARKKCLPFYCLQCRLSYSSHRRVRLHRCSKRSHSGTCFDSEKENVELRGSSSSSATSFNVSGELLACENASNKEANFIERSKDDMANSHEDRLHSCDVCSLHFQTAQLLQTHFKTHGEKPYHCSECRKRFRRRKTLVYHNSRQHGKTDLVQCEHCPKAFSGAKALEKHMDVHSGKKSFFCEVCGKGFYRQQSWLNHRRLHEGKTEFQCQQCQKSFLDKRSLEGHHSVHTGEKPHVCEVCGKRFRIARGLINHSRIHDKSAHFKCEQCPKTFIEKRSLEAHKLAHSGIKPFSCGICGKTFRRELGLMNHARLHDQTKAIRCDVCDKSFVDKWGMLKHKSIHTGEKPFTCDVCGKSFRIKKGLLDHIKLHNKDLQLKCHLCPRTFVEKRKLDIHVRAHQGEKAYVCDQCGQRFMNSMTLKVHKRRHTGEKPYKCSFCDKAFNQQGTLIAHERYHKGEKPYVCEVCGDGYVTKSHLTIHRRKHFNDRPYKCEQCDYAAFTFSLLRTHMLKHSSEKPFKCHVCPAAFKRPHHLEVHMRTHYATEKLFHCQYCDEAFDSNKKFSAHLASHEIVVVTPHQAPDEIFSTQGPGEVAYDIVLLP